MVGGGIAGMVGALSIAEQGHDVHLVEKEAELGGLGRRMHYTLEGLDVQSYLHDLVKRVYQHPLVHVYAGAKIAEATGYIGNFVTTVESQRGVVKIEHGAIIIATGADEYRPAEYLYGQDDRVMTGLELEERIAKNDPAVTGVRNLVMVQCVGCRNKDRDYCSRICCSQSLKNALKLKKVNPAMDITIIYRDMRSYGFREDYYREAADCFVRFVRYDLDNQPKVVAVEESGRSVLSVSMQDPVLCKEIALDADILVLAAAIVPSAGNQELSQLFKVALGPDGFFKEAHVKLRPVDFAADGVFLCGMAHYPKHIGESISQACGAAGRVVALLSRTRSPSRAPSVK